MKKSLLSLLLLAAGAVGTQAQLQKMPWHDAAKSQARSAQRATIQPGENQAWWGYVGADDPLEGVGVSSAETYDCAIFIPADHDIAAGKTIKGIRFAMLSSNVSNVKVWIAESRPTNITNGTVRLTSVPSTKLVTGINDVELSQPYTIGQKGIYVGYTFTVTKLVNTNDAYPVAITGEPAPNMLLLRTSKSVTSWQDINDYGRLYLQVLLEGDFPYQNAANVGTMDEVVVVPNSSANIQVPITNMGLADINSIDYTLGENGEEQHVNLQKPISFGAAAKVNITVKAGIHGSQKQKKVIITKVNGQANESGNHYGEFTLSTVTKEAFHGIAVEEYTGTTCGWCPRGLIGMEKMRKEFGDAFVGIGIHRYTSSLANDAMYISTYNQVNFSGAPSARINRGEEIDPYDGSGNGVFSDFRAAQAVPTKVAINLKGHWNEDSTQVVANAEIEALVNGDYAIEYVLIADSLTGKTKPWQQYNFYNSAYGNYTNPNQLPEDMAFLVNEGKLYNDQYVAYYPIFNDVAITVAKQNQTTAPGALSTGQKVMNSFTLDMPSESARSELINAITKERVAVVALLIDKNTKKIANAAKYYVDGYTEPQPELALADGKYYLYNTSAQKFWGSGNSWGTQASLVDEAQYATLAQQPDGTYTMETMVSNGGTSYYFGGDYMDGTAIPLTLNKQADGTYTIANAAGELYGYDGASTVLGKNIQDGPAARWEILTDDDMQIRWNASLGSATAEKPVDATFLIKDAGFGRNRRDAADVWTMEASNQNLGGGADGSHANACAESYHSTFTLSQAIENAPKGVYMFTAQGFYRQDGSDNENLPYFYINDGKSQFPVKTGSENSMTDAGVSFLNGQYTAEPIYIELAEAGTITVGAKLEENTNLWCIWDNFQLTYYGEDANINALQNAAVIAKLEDLRKQAEELLDQIDNAALKAALAEVLAATANVTASSTPDEVAAAIATLDDVVDKAQANVIAKDVLAAMKAVVDGTNVYTQAALDEYYTQWNDKYIAGTLTKDEAYGLQNPDVVTGWHAAITVDDFLLSAWDTNPNFVDAPYYINTWSVEGDNDGSNFHVPFFEYWTGDNQSLGERTLTATMNGLEAGEYQVQAWTRVRIKDGAEAPTYGITLQVNDGEAVDVCVGDNIAGTPFYLGIFTAKGNASDALKIKFNVTSDNNVSWLSFKNVTWTRLGELNGITCINADEQKNAIYNLNGQKVQKVQKGLYIQNGKKFVQK